MSCPQADIVSVLDLLEGLSRVRYCRRCFGVSQRSQCSAVPHQTVALWAHCRHPLWRTCWQLPVSAEAGNHRPRHKCQLPLVSARQDLGRLNNRHLLLEDRKRCKQHLIDNRCSLLNSLPPNRAPPSVPARIMETRPEKQKAPEVGPHPEALGRATKGPILHPRILEAPTGCPQRQSDGPDGQLCGLRVEARSHPFHRLLLGGPDRFIGMG